MNKIFMGAMLAALGAAPALAETTGPQRDPLDPTNLRQTARPSPGGGVSNAFNPAMSIIVDGAYYWDNVRGEAFEIIEEADGFAMGHGHSDGDEHGGLERGFNLREVEFAFSGTVDPYFDAFVLLVFDGDEIELEEAFITTRALPAGLQAKFGKFLSDVGYINKQHPHSWDFSDRPLVNELLFSDHGLQETGIQLSWLAPTTQYLRLGVEALQGETSGVANFIGEEAAINGTARILEDASGPRLFTGFAKFAPDLGFDHALQLGVSYGYASSFQNTEEHSTRFEDHEGTASFWGIDGVYKYTPPGAVGGRGAFKLQGEYFYRERDIDRRDVYFACHPAGIDCGDPAAQWQIGDVRNEQSFKEKQDGYYLQALYGLAPRWNIGTRIEQVGLTNETGRGDGEDWDDSRRYSAVLNYMPTEFSRLRLQFSRGDIAVDGEREKFNQVFLQFQMSLGVHGAHTF
ncbi:MAG: zinc-regulated TonB-dependent outer membrane receptor [Gammaproteobacteria bacterium]